MFGDEARAAATARRITKDLGKDFTLKSECEWLLEQKARPLEGFNELVTRLGFDNKNARLYNLINTSHPDIMQKLILQGGFTRPELLKVMKESGSISQVAKRLHVGHDYIRGLIKRDYPQYAKKLIRPYKFRASGDLRRLLATNDMAERRRLAGENGLTIQQAHNIAYDWRKKNEK